MANFKIFCDFEPEGKPATDLANQQQQQQLQHSQQLPLSQQQQQNDPLPPMQLSKQQQALLHHQHNQTHLNHLGQHHQQQPGKREPLGLRQHQPQPQFQQQQQQQVLQELVSSQSSSNTGANSSTTDSEQSEDQENDISMASLGSDFIPSILHEEAEFNEYNSFELGDEDEEDYESEGVTHKTSPSTNGNELLFDEDYDIGALVSADELVDNDDDDDLDDELRLELSQAFKEHDDSQLFKSTVYINDIETYLYKQERELDLKALPNYMAYQQDITTGKRAILINWLVEVSDEFELQTETLFICINLIDRFLSQMSVSTGNFQLLGVAAMFIASKYEEIYPPQLYQFVEITDETYTGQQICQMEQEILKTLNFRITFPTVTLFLKRIFAFNKFPKKVYHLAEYLCHLSLLVDQPFLDYYPSEIAIAAVILAAYQLDSGEKITSELKRAYDQSNQSQLERRQLPRGVKLADIDRRAFIVDQEFPFCIEALRAIQELAYKRSSDTIPADSAVYVKYCKDAHSRVAQLAPLQVEDLIKY